MEPVGCVPPTLKDVGTKSIWSPQLLQLHGCFFRWTRRIITDDHVDRITFSAVVVSESSAWERQKINGDDRSPSLFLIGFLIQPNIIPKPNIIPSLGYARPILAEPDFLASVAERGYYYLINFAVAFVRGGGDAGAGIIFHRLRLP